MFYVYFVDVVIGKNCYVVGFEVVDEVYVLVYGVGGVLVLGVVEFFEVIYLCWYECDEVVV